MHSGEGLNKFIHFVNPLLTKSLNSILVMSLLSSFSLKVRINLNMLRISVAQLSTRLANGANGLSDCRVVFLSGCLSVRLMDCETVFTCCCLPLRFSSC